MQRTAEWVQDTDEPYKIHDPEYPKIGADPTLKLWKDNPAFPAVNKKFGRKFKMVSFRWLSAEEV